MKISAAATMLTAPSSGKADKVLPASALPVFFQQLLAFDAGRQPSLALSLSDAAEERGTRVRTRRPHPPVDERAARPKVQVAFYGEGETPVAEQGPNPVVVAHVVGDEVLSLRGSRPNGLREQERRGAPLRRVLVEMESALDGQLARVTLCHPDFGPITLRVEMRGAGVVVQVVAAIPKAAAAIAASEQGLREALRGQELRLDRLVVGDPNPIKKTGQASKYAAIDEEA